MWEYKEKKRRRQEKMRVKKIKSEREEREEREEKERRKKKRSEGAGRWFKNKNGRVRKGWLETRGKVNLWQKRVINQTGNKTRENGMKGMRVRGRGLVGSGHLQRQRESKQAHRHTNRVKNKEQTMAQDVY